MALQKCTLNLNRNQMELSPHGSQEFPCAGYLALHGKSSDLVIPWHWHEELEVIYVKSGRLKLRTLGKSMLAKTGVCLFINSNILHGVSVEDDCEIWSLVFHPSLIGGQELSVYHKKYVQPLTACTGLDCCVIAPDPGWGRRFLAGFLSAFKAVDQGAAGYEFQVRDSLSESLLALYQEYEPQITAGRQEESQDVARTRAMLKFIHGHYQEDLALGRIAETAGIGERECLRCFRRIMQISPVQYLIKYRIMRGAAMLLENPAATVAEIASRCGFDSPSSFSQKFRRFYSCTPREYRKQAAGGGESAITADY